MIVCTVTLLLNIFKLNLINLNDKIRFWNDGLIFHCGNNYYFKWKCINYFIEFWL